MHRSEADAFVAWHGSRLYAPAVHESNPVVADGPAGREILPRRHDTTASTSVSAASSCKRCTRGPGNASGAPRRRVMCGDGALLKSPRMIGNAGALTNVVGLRLESQSEDGDA